MTLHSRPAADSEESLVGLTNSLMSTIVLPCLGAAAARRGFDRLVPVSPPAAPQVELQPTDPFKDAGMRLTSYRTVRALSAIADHPGASSHLVAGTSEINDQGQISKLLARLQRAGMVTNTEATLGKGAPKNWALTAKGAQVVETNRVHTKGRCRPGVYER